MGDWRLLLLDLLLYSISWFRGDAQRNIRKYERWDLIRKNQKSPTRQGKRIVGKRQPSITPRQYFK